MNLPPYAIFPEVNSETVVLRRVATADLIDLMEISFYDTIPAKSLDDAAAMQERIDLDYQNGSSIHWGIANKHTNEMMGTVGYYRGFENGIGELGCVLRPKFRGQGYMTTAIKLATEFGLDAMGLTKVIAITSLQNAKTIKLLERASFVKTADLPEDEVEYQFIKKFTLKSL